MAAVSCFNIRPSYMTTTNFPSLTAGPGTTRPVHALHGGESDVGVAGVTTFRVSNKDWMFVDVVGWRSVQD